MITHDNVFKIVIEHFENRYFIKYFRFQMILKTMSIHKLICHDFLNQEIVYYTLYISHIYANVYKSKI